MRRPSYEAGICPHMRKAYDASHPPGGPRKRRAVGWPLTRGASWAGRVRGMPPAGRGAFCERPSRAVRGRQHARGAARQAHRRGEAGSAPPLLASPRRLVGRIRTREQLTDRAPRRRRRGAVASGRGTSVAWVAQLPRAAGQAAADVAAMDLHRWNSTTHVALWLETLGMQRCGQSRALGPCF